MLSLMSLGAAANFPRKPIGRLVASAAPCDQWVWEMEGPPGAPALMLVHGWMATAALNWYPSLPHLANDFRVIAPNLRGHGRQGGIAPPFSLDGCSEDLAALVEALGLRGVIVVGYSMGGAVAQVLARRHGELLGGIVLCATAASFAQRLKLRPLVRACGQLTSGAARAWPAGAAGFLRWRIERHDRAVAARRMRKGRAPVPPEDNWALEERELSHIAAFIESGAELNAYDSSPWLAELQVPAAAVVTLRDRVVARWRQEAMAALLPNCTSYQVDAGHDAVFAAPGRFLPTLTRACLELARTGGHL
ncbi:MAG TPA: alpha/beta hydrolase [Acidimicrobiales bacterium]|nr:alpha/beta hydrolase [Acidimicrobiales bacterium]